MQNGKSCEWWHIQAWLNGVMDESRHDRDAIHTLTGMKGCSGRGTSNGISVSVKSELSSMSIEPSSMAYIQETHMAW